MHVRNARSCPVLALRSALSCVNNVAQKRNLTHLTQSNRSIRETPAFIGLEYRKRLLHSSAYSASDKKEDESEIVKGQRRPLPTKGDTKFISLKKSADLRTKIEEHSALGKGFQDLILFDDQGGTKCNMKRYGDKSFQVNDKLIRQSIILLPSSVLLWDVKTYDEVTIDSLAVIEMIYPTIEILFIGTGAEMPDSYPYELAKHFRKKGIAIELSNTSHAASTFNVLNAEGRNVAAALLTLVPTGPEEYEFDRSIFNK